MSRIPEIKYSASFFFFIVIHLFVHSLENYSGQSKAILCGLNQNQNLSGDLFFRDYFSEIISEIIFQRLLPQNEVVIMVNKGT